MSRRLRDFKIEAESSNIKTGAVLKEFAFIG